jgi:hypothetical protein
MNTAGLVFNNEQTRSEVFRPGMALHQLTLKSGPLMPVLIWIFKLHELRMGRKTGRVEPSLISTLLIVAG